MNLMKIMKEIRGNSLSHSLVSILISANLLFPTLVLSQSPEWTVYNTVNSGLPYNGVTAIDFDAQGTAWIGTGRWWAYDGGGLAKFDGQNWTVYNTANSGLPDNDHTGLYIDADDNIWSGTENGLSKFDGINWTVYNTNNSEMMNNQTGAPIFDDEGNAWIACGCLAKFDGDNWTVYHTGNSGLPNNFVTGLDIDSYGNIWAGTFGNGVAVFNLQNWTVYNTSNSNFPHNDVSFLVADDEGNVWVGTYGGGLAKFSNIGWTAYTKANSGLPDDWIWNLSVDPQGNVWAGTKAGLARFDGLNWTVYNKDNSGLPDNNVYYIAFDDSRAWIGTENGGLAVYSPPPAVDFNGDRVIDINDLIILIECWGTDETLCDINPLPWGDGIIDRKDLEVFMSYWGEDYTFKAHWKLDEMMGDIAHDSIGENDGTLYGEQLWQPEGGMIDGALEFDGINDYVSTPFVLNPATGSFSVFAWIKGGEPGQVILSQIEGASWLSTDTSDGALMTELKGGGRSGSILKSQTVITDDTWHRIGFTWDGVNRILYVDDIIAAQNTQPNLSGSEGGLYIGAGNTLDEGTLWNGLVDDVRIYDRVITP